MLDHDHTMDPQSCSNGSILKRRRWIWAGDFKGIRDAVASEVFSPVIEVKIEEG